MTTETQLSDPQRRARAWKNAQLGTSALVGAGFAFGYVPQALVKDLAHFTKDMSRWLSQEMLDLIYPVWGMLIDLAAKDTASMAVAVGIALSGWAGWHYRQNIVTVAKRMARLVGKLAGRSTKNEPAIQTRRNFRQVMRKFRNRTLVVGTLAVAGSIYAFGLPAVTQQAWNVLAFGFSAEGRAAVSDVLGFVSSVTQFLRDRPETLMLLRGAFAGIATYKSLAYVHWAGDKMALGRRMSSFLPAWVPRMSPDIKHGAAAASAFAFFGYFGSKHFPPLLGTDSFYYPVIAGAGLFVISKRDALMKMIPHLRHGFAAASRWVTQAKTKIKETREGKALAAVGAGITTLFLYNAGSMLANGTGPAVKTGLIIAAYRGAKSAVTGIGGGMEFVWAKTNNLLLRRNKSQPVVAPDHRDQSTAGVAKHDTVGLG